MSVKILMEVEVSDQLIIDAFITAMEGCIGYWSVCTKYHWCKDGNPKDEDYDNFYAHIHDAEDKDQSWIIDKAVIVNGIRRILGGKLDISGSIVQYLTAAVREDDAGDIDADVADCIVQAGLFNEIVFS